MERESHASSFAMQTFGCQTWDAVFAIQAIMSSNLCDEYATTLRKAHDFIKASQVISYLSNINTFLWKDLVLKSCLF